MKKVSFSENLVTVIPPRVRGSEVCHLVGNPIRSPKRVSFSENLVTEYPLEDIQVKKENEILSNSSRPGRPGDCLSGMSPKKVTFAELLETEIPIEGTGKDRLNLLVGGGFYIFDDVGVFDGLTRLGEPILTDFFVKEDVSYVVGKGLVLDSNRDLCLKYDLGNGKLDFKLVLAEEVEVFDELLARTMMIVLREDTRCVCFLLYVDWDEYADVDGVSVCRLNAYGSPNSLSSGDEHQLFDILSQQNVNVTATTMSPLEWGVIERVKAKGVMIVMDTLNGGQLLVDSLPDGDIIKWMGIFLCCLRASSTQSRFVEIHFHASGRFENSGQVIFLVIVYAVPTGMHLMRSDQAYVDMNLLNENYLSFKSAGGTDLVSSNWYFTAVTNVSNYPSWWNLCAPKGKYICAMIIISRPRCQSNENVLPFVIDVYSEELVLCLTVNLNMILEFAIWGAESQQFFCISRARKLQVRSSATAVNKNWFLDQSWGALILQNCVLGEGSGVAATTLNNWTISYAKVFPLAVGSFAKNGQIRRAHACDIQGCFYDQNADSKEDRGNLVSPDGGMQVHMEGTLVDFYHWHRREPCNVLVQEVEDEGELYSGVNLVACRREMLSGMKILCSQFYRCMTCF